MFKHKLEININGHVLIQDDLGNVLLDKDNAIHQENFSRIIARAVSNENNYILSRIAFGNGGTTTDAASVVTLNPPNTGVPPDTRTWDSRLYQEIYSEIVNAGNSVINPQLGVDPGSADSNTGNRSGGDSVPSNDPTTVLHVSGPGVRSVETGLTSQIIITSVVNSSEPTFTTALNPFSFDEIGLYTTGTQALSSPGYQNVNVGNKSSTDNTNLIANVPYTFQLSVDNGGFVTITVISPISQPTYGAFCDALNTGDVSWNPLWAGVSPLPAGSTVSITDTTNNYSTITGSVTYGYIKFTSATVGSTSSIVLNHGLVNDLFASNVLAPSLAANLLSPIPGASAGVQNDPLAPQNERERLLTHLVFNPITKGPGRTLIITYTITVAAAQSTT